MAAEGPGAVRDLPFECAVCGRAFSTATGRGLHVKRAHVGEFNRLVPPPAARQRWDIEELYLLAREEHAVRRDGYQGNINRVLAARFEGRTYDAVKCARARQDYREMYANALIDQPPVFVGIDVLPGLVMRGERELLEALERISPALNEWTLATLRLIISGAAADPGLIDFLDPIVRSFSELPPPPELTSVAVGSCAVGTHPRSTRQKYARLQEMWKEAPGRVCGAVLDSSETPPFSAQQFYDQWKPIVEAPSCGVPDMLPRVPRVPDPASVMRFFTGEMVARMSTGSSSSGPDGITWSSWRAVPLDVRVLLLNICLVFGRVPMAWVRARTTMITKGPNTLTPLDCRPISVAGVCLRVFHRLLAARLESAIDLHRSQFGFRAGVDGVAVGVDCLNSTIRETIKTRRSVRILSLDLRKAFDSVSHQCVLESLKIRGIPSELVSYIRWLYEVGTLHIFARGQWAAPLRPMRGVRQGDPLSSVLFNSVFDIALRSLDETIGVRVGGARIGSLAYADDLLLFSSTIEGARRQLGCFVEAAGSIGLSVNIGKSFLLSLVAAGRRKTVAVRTEELVVGDQRLPTASIDHRWTYLGVPFDVWGITHERVLLTDGLSTIREAPLKPHQKLYVLCAGFLPRFYHPLFLGKTPPGVLRALDVQVRAWVRGVLSLPHDCPNAFLHASVRDGGLGVPSFAVLVPGVRRARLIRARTLWRPAELDEEVPDEGVQFGSRAARAKHHADQLALTLTGVFLMRCRDVGASSGFLSPATTELSGREFVSFIKLRAGALPCRERMGRGRLLPLPLRACRGCGAASETLYHIVQMCPVSHGGRVLRHDSLVRFLAESFRRRHGRVLVEQAFAVGFRQLRPDLVVCLRGRVIVIDVQVVVGGPDFDTHHRAKVAKYSLPELLDSVARHVGIQGVQVEVCAVTVSWLGIWHRSSWGCLKSLGLGSPQMRWISERVARGSHMNYARWMTMVRGGVMR